MNSPRWRKARGPDRERVEAFLRTAEFCCVNACSRYLRRDAGRDHVWFLADSGNDIRALLIHSRQMLFPIFRGRKDIPLPRFMDRFLGKISIHAIQGLREDTEYLENLIIPLGYTRDCNIDYELMALDKPPLPRSLLSGPPGLDLWKPDLADVEKLFPLQAAYEREEVLPPGAEFHAAASRLSLERTLRREHVLAAELGGRVVGKINTNALAFSRYQIGGVYVLPGYRGLGIATRMTAELCRALIAKGWGLSLFVKKRNAAARRLYRRIGFNGAGDYRITYY